MNPAGNGGAAAQAQEGGARRGILILHIEPPSEERGAEHQYRTRQPCRALGTLGDVTVVSGSLLSPTIHALLSQADVLVMSDVTDPDLLPLLDIRRRARRLSVYEINHHHLFPPPGVPAPAAGDLIGRSLSPQLARQSDCLQVPTDELDRRFRLVNPRRTVLPSNQWEAPTPRPPARAQDGIVRIGWGGGRGHLEDVRWIAPVLRETARRHTHVRIALHGEEPFRELFADLGSGAFEFTPASAQTSTQLSTETSTTDAYEQFLDGLSLGIAPLLPTTYNRCRSDSKFLEYAAHHVPAIYSDLEPHASVHARDLGLRFTTLEDLAAVVDRALAEPEVPATLAARAVRYIDRERLELPLAPRRLGFYLSAMAGLGYGAAAPVSFLDELAQEPTYAGSRYIEIKEDIVQRLLAAALKAAAAGDAGEATRLFDEAGARAPTFHLPRLLAGVVEADPRRALPLLRRASELAPRSCRAAYEMGVRLHTLGDAAGARTAWERCRALAPAFGAAEARLADLADAEGRLDEACRYFEEAALHNSFLAWPVTRLAAMAIDGGQLDRAVALLRPLLEHDEALWLTNFLLGRACLDMGHVHEARVHLLRALEASVENTVDRAAVVALLATAELRLGATNQTRARFDELRNS